MHRGRDIGELGSFFLVKPASPWGHTRSAEALFSFVSQQPRSLSSPATNQPSTRDGQGASWATSSTDTTPARVRGLVLKRTSHGQFLFSTAPSRGQASAVKGQATNGQNVQTLCHQDHATQRRRALVALPTSTCPTLLLPPCSRFVSLCAAPTHHGAVLTILRLARLCLVYGRLSSPVDPKDCTHTQPM